MAVLTSPNWETITDGMRRLLNWMGQQDFVSQFYLAGGTGLALQIGHRRSVDLDFFSAMDEVPHMFSRQFLLPIDGWVLAIDIISNFRFRHCPAHLWGKSGDGI
jgi:hypothetical protein